MKPGQELTQSTNRKHYEVILLATLGAVIAASACTSNPKPPAAVSQPASGSVRPVAMAVTEPAGPKTVAVAEVSKPSVVTKPAAKLLTYRSRDYGISFVYPWQYSYVNAKTIANGDTSLRPKPDGHEGQFTLARVEVPKGFYPDTDFKSGYFLLSLNQDMSEQECTSSLSADPAKLQMETINGVDFRWTEQASGGRGSASKTRNYVAFSNDTCYEMELGVKTENDGLAREIDPDQVMHRLNAILKTVKIDTGAEKPATPKLQSSAENKPASPKN